MVDFIDGYPAHWTPEQRENARAYMRARNAKRDAAMEEAYSAEGLLRAAAVAAVAVPVCAAAWAVTPGSQTYGEITGGEV